MTMDTKEDFLNLAKASLPNQMKHTSDHNDCFHIFQILSTLSTESVIPYNLSVDTIKTISILAVGAIKECLRCNDEILLLKSKHYKKKYSKIRLGKGIYSDDYLCRKKECRAIINNQQQINYYWARKKFAHNIPVTNNDKDWKQCRKIYKTLVRLSVNELNRTVPVNTPNELFKIISVYAVGSVNPCFTCKKEILVVNNTIYSKAAFAKVSIKVDGVESNILLCGACNLCQKKKRNFGRCNICQQLLFTKPKILTCKGCDFSKIRICQNCYIKYISYDIYCNSDRHYSLKHSKDMNVFASCNGKLNDKDNINYNDNGCRSRYDENFDEMYCQYDSNFNEIDNYQIKNKRKSKLMSKANRKNYGTMRPDGAIFDNF